MFVSNRHVPQVEVTAVDGLSTPHGADEGTRHLDASAAASGPIPAGARSSRPASSNQVRGIGDLRVMLVDDDPLIRRVLGRVLKRVVASVTTCEDGAAALEVLLAEDWQRPHVILTDLAMPNVNGFELAREVQKRDLGIHVIMVTAYPPADTRAYIAQGLVASVITKPVKFAAIRSALSGLLGDVDGSPPGSDS